MGRRNIVKAKFEDILQAANRKPLWYDDHGTPRFSPYYPELSPNIYSDESCLYEIKCQYCHEKFLVSECWDRFESISHPYDWPANMSECIKKEMLSYGDPPRHDCVGDTMTSDTIRVVEFWKKAIMKWNRIPDLEIEFKQE